MPPRLLARTPDRLSGPAIPSRPDDLTTREREVLDLRAEGASNQQIARSLGVSLKTVQNHVSHILDKLQAADRTQAALRARHRWELGQWILGTARACAWWRDVRLMTWCLFRRNEYPSCFQRRERGVRLLAVIGPRTG